MNISAFKDAVKTAKQQKDSHYQAVVQRRRAELFDEAEIADFTYDRRHMRKKQSVAYVPIPKNLNWKAQHRMIKAIIQKKAKGYWSEEEKIWYIDKKEI